MCAKEEQVPTALNEDGLLDDQANSLSCSPAMPPNRKSCQVIQQTRLQDMYTPDHGFMTLVIALLSTNIVIRRFRVTGCP
eukprot:4102124-Pyramimonas_sp.AAC.1